MCLVIAYSRAVTAAPLVVAANRDELRSRPAMAMDVLQEREPRILGGRDLMANGTWLAVNEWGVVAALTNDPATLRSRDPKRRSRGEIPLRLARHRTAREAAAELFRTVHGDEYNPCFVLVGDRMTLQYLAIGDGIRSPPIELPAGVHVLENLPLEARSRKTDLVRSTLPKPGDHRLMHRLWTSLESRAVPQGPADPRRPPASEAAFVDSGSYGTRWSGIVAVPAAGRPRFVYSEQPRTSRGPRCVGWRANDPVFRGDRSSSDNRI
jgi:uncharacterized protein with NRDE domain